MRNDLEVIVRQYPTEWRHLNVYAIGDVHVGAPEFDEKATRRKIEIIRDDPHGVLCLCGDLGDYGLKNSKTNVYQATMQPKEQQEFVYELFKPVADKIVAAVPGNHEERITKEVGLCPLYDLCVRWGIEDVYRENVAITKYVFGSRNGGTKQNVFVGVTSHGSSRNRHHAFAASFDGADFLWSGHVHTPSYTPHGKIVIDTRSATAKHAAYREVVVDANLKVGGYGLKKEYEVKPPAELQYLELRTTRDPKRNVHKIINFHTIQIG